MSVVWLLMIATRVLCQNLKTVAVRSYIYRYLCEHPLSSNKKHGPQYHIVNTNAHLKELNDLTSQIALARKRIHDTETVS